LTELQRRAASGLVMVVVALLALWFGGQLFALLLALIAALMLREWIGLTGKLRWGVIGLVAGIVYVSVPSLALAGLRAASFGLALWTLVIVWATDIGAYGAGRSIGGPRIAPAISPSKTWAGLGGGMIAAAGIGAFIAIRYALPAPCLWLGAPLAVLAQIGDFFESWMKRRAGVKDSGRLIPGHGGILDRLDGLVPVASAMGLLLVMGALA